MSIVFATLETKGSLISPTTPNQKTLKYMGYFGRPYFLNETLKKARY